MKKKLLKVWIYILLIGGSTTLSLVPTTNAIYYLDNQNALSYMTNLYNLFDGDKSMTFTGGTEENIKLRFFFPVNPYVDITEKDAYTITVPSGCIFPDEPKVSGATLEQFNDVFHRVTYKPNAHRAENIEVNMSCKISSIIYDEENITASVSVTESIGEGSDKEEFIYARRNYSISVEDYKELIKVEEDDLYGTFSQKVQALADSLGYQAVYDYIINRYDSEEALRGMSSIPGLSVAIERDENGKETVSITAQQNLVGYARTWSSNKTTAINPTRSYNFYIDTTVEKEIKDAFDIYLKNYFFPDETKRQKVQSYVNEKGGIVAFTKGEVKIYGLINDASETSRYLINIPNLLLAVEQTENVVTIPIADINTGTTTTETAIRSFIRNEYSDIAELILNNPENRIDLNEIYSSLMTGASNRSNVNKRNIPGLYIKEAHAFLDYFALYDNKLNHYVLIKAFSTYPNEPGKHIGFDTLEVPAGTTIDFKNIDDENGTSKYLTVSMRGTSETDINNTIKKLEVYFDLSDGSITPEIKNESGSYTTEFTLNKNVETSKVEFTSVGTTNEEQPEEDQGSNDSSVEEIPEIVIPDEDEPNSDNPTEQDFKAIEELLSPSISGGSNPESPVKLAEQAEEIPEINRTKLKTRTKSEEVIEESDINIIEKEDIPVDFEESDIISE